MPLATVEGREGDTYGEQSKPAATHLKTVAQTMNLHVNVSTCNFFGVAGPRSRPAEGHADAGGCAGAVPVCLLCFWSGGTTAVLGCPAEQVGAAICNLTGADMRQDKEGFQERQGLRASGERWPAVDLVRHSTYMPALL